MLTTLLAVAALFAPATPADRVVVGDLLPLVERLIARPAVRAEIAEGGVPVVLRAHGVDPAAWVPALLAAPAVAGPWLPTQIVVEMAPGGWPALARWRAALVAGAVDPPPVVPLAGRITFRSPDAATVVAGGLADALGLAPDGPGRWKGGPLAAPPTTVFDHLRAAHLAASTIARDGAAVTFSVGGAAPPAPVEATALLDVRWDTAVGAAPADRAALADWLGPPGPGRFTVSLGRLVEWTGEWPAATEPPPGAALLGWLPRDAAGIRYDLRTPLPEAVGSDDVRALLAGFVDHLDPPLSGGHLLVLGPDRPCTAHIEQGPSRFESPTVPLPAAALVLPAAKPAATLESARARLAADGVTLAPHPLDGARAWALAPDWSRAFGIERVEVAGAELHVFAGPDALVLSSDDALSAALLAARAGRGRAPRPPAGTELWDRGGTTGALRLAAGFAATACPFLSGEAARAPLIGMALIRLAAAAGAVERSAQRIGDRLQVRGRLLDEAVDLPPLGGADPVAQRAVTDWLVAWCASGVLTRFPEADGQTLVRARGAIGLGSRPAGDTIVIAADGHGDQRERAPWKATGPDDAPGRATDRAALAALLADPGRPVALTAELPSWRALDALRAARTAGRPALRLVVADADAPPAPAAPDPARVEALSRVQPPNDARTRQMAIVAELDAIGARCPAAPMAFDGLLENREVDNCPPFTAALTSALARCEPAATDRTLALLSAMAVGGSGTKPFGLERRLADGPATWAAAGTWGDVAPALLIAEAIPIGAP